MVENDRKQFDDAGSRPWLENVGLRCTRQREAVYSALRSTKSHPTADELYQMLVYREHTLSRATVYNALNAMADSGLIRRIACDNGPLRFDADLSEHVHVRYRETGRVMDLPEHLKQKLMCTCCREALESIATDLGLDLDQLTVELIARERSPRCG